MMVIRLLFTWLAAGLVAAGTLQPLAAEVADTVPRPPLGRSEPGAVEQTGAIVGRLIDGTTGDPVTNAYVRLRELGRNELSHGDGSFHFLELGPRSYTILAQRIGYAPAERRVEVREGETTEVQLVMMPSALEMAGIVVTATGRERGVGDTFRPTTVVGEAELRRRLEVSLAATIDHVPGISQQYNGPAASQPVIRGMGGDRVLVLEDGQRTGDLSTTAGDHAVTVDPFTARRIEVVRGPAGLMYGSNALGGVINVVREDVPRTLPESVSGSAGIHAESVNEGVAGGGSLLVPHGRLAIRGEVNGRLTGDTRTPLGELPSSDLRSFGGGLGASWIARWGYLGGAYRDQDLRYGIPGEFGDEAIPGAHPSGTQTESRRRNGRVEASHFLGFGPVSSVSFDANLVHYTHREIEERIDEEVIYGAIFDNLFGSANLLVRHEHELDPIFTEGAFGLYASGRDLRTAGGFTGSRDASAATFAGYVFEELAILPFRIQIGGRYDLTKLTPIDLTPIRSGNREVPVRERTFGALSGSVAALFEARPGVTLGANIARAFRTPSIEELYSDGPHLADYSYDVGSPDLAAETGIGGDLFLRINRPRLQAEASLFRNAISNYIYHAPTGEIDTRFFRFPVFEARGTDATFAGGEIGIQWEGFPRVVLDGSIAVVRATRDDTGEPLPAIPPLNGMLSIRYETDRYFLSAGWNASAAQNRVPHPIESPVVPGATILVERPTAGYGLANMGLGLRYLLAGRLHTLTLQVDNLTDRVWRDHLSRIKEVAPQPGRNVQLLYRVYF